MMTTRALRHLTAALSGLVATALVLLAGASGPASAVDGDYRANPGPYFETPGSSTITNLVLRNIRNTPSGAYIRFVSWSFTSGDVADALSDAHDRGVVVRVLMSRGQLSASSTARDLQTQLGGDSWLRGVKNSARGDDKFDDEWTALHQKSFTFSTTGQSKRVSIVASANPTDHARDAQFHDAYQFVGNEAVYDKLVDVFQEQTEDSPEAKPFLRWSTRRAALVFSPWNSPSMDDPVVGRIENLPNHARIRIANSAWQGPRGVAIARAVAAHERSQQGRDVWVLASSPFADDVRRILRAQDIPIFKGYWHDERYHHHKFMTARWSQDGEAQTRVWTGSENWSNASRGNDELVLRVHGFKAHEKYVAFFDKVVGLPD